MKTIISFVVAMVFVVDVWAEDVVRFRDKSAQGERPIKEAKGKIEGETIAAVILNGKPIATQDIVEIQYDTPVAIRQDLEAGYTAEAKKNYDDAMRLYRAPLLTQGAAMSKSVKRNVEWRLAWLLTLKSDDSAESAQKALQAVEKFIADHPEGWQRLGAVRAKARLLLDKTPPDTAAAIRAFDELGKTPGISAEMKAECQSSAVDMFLLDRKFAEAQARIANWPSGEFRTAAYLIAAEVDPAAPSIAVKRLEELLAKADNAQKPLLHNLIGGCWSASAHHQKDALWSHLWVDVVYNNDAIELAKARMRLSGMFKELNNESKSKYYRDKVVGR